MNSTYSQPCLLGVYNLVLSKKTSFSIIPIRLLLWVIVKVKFFWSYLSLTLLSSVHIRIMFIILCYFKVWYNFPAGLLKLENVVFSHKKKTHIRNVLINTEYKTGKENNQLSHIYVPNQIPGTLHIFTTNVHIFSQEIKIS